MGGRLNGGALKWVGAQNWISQKIPFNPHAFPPPRGDKTLTGLFESHLNCIVYWYDSGPPHCDVVEDVGQNHDGWPCLAGVAALVGGPGWPGWRAWLGKLQFLGKKRVRR